MANDVTYRLIGSDELVVVINYGAPYVVSSAHKRFNDIVNLVRKLDHVDEIDDTDVQELEHLLSDVKVVESFLEGQDEIKITGNAIYYRGEPLHGVLIDRILNMIQTGVDGVDPLVQFLNKLQQNPSARAREQLFGFLDRGKNAITKDGDFLSYKKVRSNYMDIHSNSMLNQPGTRVEMDRSRVDDDPTRTCSYGLHVCSYQYLPRFGSGTSQTDRVVVCKVNPKDVVAVPTDYNDTKMRVCAYEVLKDITDEIGEDVLGTNSIYNEDEWEFSDYIDDENWESSDAYC